MERGSFYDGRRKERKIDFLADYRVVKRYFCRANDLRAGDFDLLLKLHSIGDFLRADFYENKGHLAWCRERWDRLHGKWIVTYRERRPSKGQNYKIYRISRSAHTMIERCYKTICGEIAIPETKRYNPIMKEKTYIDTKYAAAIRAFNLARNNK